MYTELMIAFDNEKIKSQTPGTTDMKQDTAVPEVNISIRGITCFSNHRRHILSVLDLV
jgi:hypothetical protein